MREALAALPEALAGGEAKELSGLLAAVGAGEGGLPERMAEVNEVLAALPAPASERLLTAFVSELYCGAP
ncbi:MAG: hypothetical protein D6731_04290 [Planctomycetota bacterium]|nr:MAG: hypothetical protein D6731_04290 [Planctomycetota bacterium]